MRGGGAYLLLELVNGCGVAGIEFLELLLVELALHLHFAGVVLGVGGEGREDGFVHALELALALL